MFYHSVTFPSYITQYYPYTEYVGGVNLAVHSQALKQDPVSLSSDVFSYGMVLYELFVCKLPYYEVNDIKAANKIINGVVCQITIQ